MSNSDKGRPSRRRFLLSTAMLGAAASLGAAACGTGGPPPAKKGEPGKKGGTGGGRQGKLGETLFFAGMQWGTPTQFNPLNAANTGWPCGQGGNNYVYEVLLRYNLLSGELEPGLGKELKTPDATTFEIPLQSDAKWQDGKPVTVDDVVFTFELAKRNSTLAYADMWNYVTSVEAKGTDTVVFKLNSKKLNPGTVKGVISGVFVLPKHVWEPIEKSGKLTTYENKKPVGSGPYQLDQFNAQQVQLVRYDGYWGKSIYGSIPEPKYLVHQIFKDNQGGDLALEEGKVDVSQQFTPQIWKMWEDKKLPVSTWFKKQPYHVPGGIPMLVVNVSKKGLDNPKVRRAIGFALDYARIASTAMSNYSVPASSSVIVPEGAEKAFFDQAAVDANGWKHDPAQTKKILEEELGAKKGGDGVYTLKDGTRLGPWSLQTPSGWSDWQDALRIVEGNLKDAGFDVATKFPQAETLTPAMQNGNFDISCWYVAGTGPATPWQRFRDVLDIRGVPAAGKAGFWNYGRFSHPDVAALLDKVAAETDQAKAKDLYGQLDKIFMENAPMIPLMYRPVQFFEFNESTWTGFPTSEDPYAAPTFQGSGNAWLFKIKHV